MQMKCLALITLAFVCPTLWGQSNTFPPSGNVGVGTTSPTLKFVVSNAGAQGFEVNPTTPALTGGVDLVFYNRSSSGYAPVYFDASAYTFNRGNVGIGTNNPVLKFVVSKNGAQGLEVNPVSPTVAGAVDIAFYNRSNSTYIPAFFDASAYIFNRGNLGVGTTNPTLKFVVSNSGAQGFEINPNTPYITGGVDVVFYNRSAGAYAPAFFDASVYSFNRGNVGIGLTNPSYPLHVNGTIRASTLITNGGTWPDYVFSGSHQLAPLSETEDFITSNGHLPGVPSAAEISESGVDVGSMQRVLLEKIEEITLRLIDISKQNDCLKKRIMDLENKK